jgi:hypothetical protein
MRKMGWALIGMTALMAGGLQVAEAGVSCKMIPSWCPVNRTIEEQKTKPTSVPEPEMLMLFGAGITAVGAAALRRRKNKKN